MAKATDKRKQAALRAVKRTVRMADGGATDDLPDVGPAPIGDGGQFSKGYDWANKAANFATGYAGHVAQGIGDMLTAPGKIMTPNPHKEGSEEWYQYERDRDRGAQNWSNGTALALMAGGMQAAEPGAAGIFGGKLMKTWDKDAAAEALNQEARGVAPDRIWRGTGTGRGADNKLRQEIDDSGATLNPGIDWKENKAGYVAGSLPYARSMSQVLDHPELYKPYPEAANIPVYPLPAAGADKGGYFQAAYGDTPAHIALTDEMWNPKGYRESLLHELQHWVQNKEGFQGGTSPSRFMPNIKSQLADFEKAKADAESSIKAQGVKEQELNSTKAFIKAHLESPKLIHGSQFADLWYKVKSLPYYPQLENIVKTEMHLEKAKATATEKYMRTKGETEARNVEKRADFPEWERLSRPPELTQDRPNFLQTDRPGFAEGGNVPDNAFNPADFAAFKASAAPAAPAAGAFNPDDFAKFKASQLPDVGPPAISVGQGEFSPGLPAVNEEVDRIAKSANQNLIEPIKHPIDTATGIVRLGAGLGQYATMGALGEGFKPNVDALAADYAKTYGSLEGFGTALKEDPVRVAMDVSGGLGLLRGAGRRAGVLPRPAAPVAAPSLQELRSASNNNYNTMKGFGVELHPHVMDQVATNIETELLNEGYRNYIPGHNAIFNAVDELRRPVGRYTTISDIDGPRRALNKIGADPALRDGTRRAITQIDDALANVTPADAAINPQFAPRLAREAQAARGNYAAFKQAEQIEQATDRAGLQAASTGSGANIDNATRQKFRAILNNPRKMRGYSPDEIAAMRQLVQGTFTGNAARLVGKLAPSGIVSGGLSAALGHAVGHTVGVPALGYIAKQIADNKTARAAARLSETRRLRSPEAQRIGATPAPGARWLPPAGGSIQAGRLGAMTNTDNPYGL